MTLDYLRYFVTVAEKLNFTKAAEACHIAQTAMSRCIASIEMEVGVELLKRDHRSVTLTPAGELFYHSAKDILDLYEQSVARARRIAAQEENTLHIGIGPFARAVAFQIIRHIQSACPSLHIILENHEYREMTGLLQAGTLDAGFFLPRVNPHMLEQGFAAVPVSEAKYPGLIFSKDHRFAQMETITPTDLSEEVVLTTSGEDGPTSLEYFRQILREDGIVPRSVIPVNSFETELLMVESGAGVALVPHFPLSELPKEIEIRQVPFGKLGSFLLCYRSDSHSLPLESFLKGLSQIKLL